MNEKEKDKDTSVTTRPPNYPDATLEGYLKWMEEAVGGTPTEGQIAEWTELYHKLQTMEMPSIPIDRSKYKIVTGDQTTNLLDPASLKEVAT